MTYYWEEEGIPGFGRNYGLGVWVMGNGLDKVGSWMCG